MDSDVAHCAGLIFLGLIMERWDPWRRRIHRERMTLQTHQVYLAAFQQTRVARPVGCVAGKAAFGLDRSVFKGKRTRFVGMAIEADLVFGSGGSQLPGKKPSVLVVTIAAQNQPLIHTMMKWFGEVRFDLKVTAVAQGRLRRPQQLPVDFWRMYRVAVHTANVVS